MLNLKNAPVGIDLPVQRFQQFFYPLLKKSWNLQEADFDCNGRCYRNQTDRGYVPEVFVSSESPDPTNTVYKEVFFDDTNTKALCFFHVSDIVKYDHGNVNARVAWIFMVNVPALKPSLLHRGDEEIRIDVEKVAAQRKYGFELQEMVTGYKSVFAEFDGWLKPDQVTFRDMHPLHCFRLNLNLLYDISDC